MMSKKQLDHCKRVQVIRRGVRLLQNKDKFIILLFVETGIGMKFHFWFYFFNIISRIFQDQEIQSDKEVVSLSFGSNIGHFGMKIMQKIH